jgi:hypothetical protein
LTILNSIVTASISREGVAVGSGSAGSGGSSSVDRLIVRSGPSVFEGNSAQDFSISASAIVLHSASLVFRTKLKLLFEKTPSRLGDLNLSILFGSTTTTVSEPLSGLNLTFLHIAHLSLPAQRD